MMQKLIDLLTYYRNAMFNSNSPLEPKRCADQAYGAVQMFILLHPDLEAEAVALWYTTYRPDFQRALYGSLI